MRLFVVGAQPLIRESIQKPVTESSLQITKAGSAQFLFLLAQNCSVTYHCLTVCLQEHSRIHHTTTFLRSAMSSNEPTLADGLMLPDRESILDVMNDCNCSETKAINLLQVSSSHFEDPQKRQQSNRSHSTPTMTLKKPNTVIER